MNKVTVWYDGGCPLCLREIALFRSLDKKGAIQFVDLTLPGTFCPLDRKFMLRIRPRLQRYAGGRLKS